MANAMRGERGGGASFHGAALRAIPRAYKPPRDRMVAVKHGAACPDCKAQIGAPCVNLTTGEEQLACHRARRRMAIRAERERQE